ncbi:MAG TPA: VCBS repeat-containing protein, partial [Candidatus Paceibacterota bacterium]|nr:VCBS repeat-containing protein [Candidatus Paceibacterota bacterium]
MRTITAMTLSVLALFAVWAGRAADDQAGFGFQGPEIFPIDNLISLLRAADFDGDGAQDLIVVNNARSKINILFNRAGKTNDLAAQPIRREINELPPDARFRIESLASEKTISALVVTDLNQDQRPDLAFFGAPKELVVQYNEGANTWSAPRRWSLEDGLLDPNALTSGDLNGDGLEDLLLLGESTLYFLAQQPDHALAEPEKIPYSGVVKAAQIIDIDGDGRSDLMLVNWEHANPFRFRLQNAAGQLGPEVHFTLPAIRSYAMEDLDGDKKTEVMTIAAKSGRAQISNFILKPAEALTGDFSQGQFQVVPFAKTTKNRRGIAWADVSHDGLSDLLVAEPDSGQVSLFLQQPDGSLAAPRTFPTFTGVGELGVADWDGDGRAEIFFLSADERQIGVSRLDEAGRIAFPTLIPIEGRPLTMAAGRVRADQKPLLAAVVDVDGK